MKIQTGVSYVKSRKQVLSSREDYLNFKKGVVTWQRLENKSSHRERTTYNTGERMEALKKVSRKQVLSSREDYKTDLFDSVDIYVSKTSPLIERGLLKSVVEKLDPSLSRKQVLSSREDYKMRRKIVKPEAKMSRKQVLSSREDYYKRKIK